MRALLFRTPMAARRARGKEAGCFEVRLRSVTAAALPSGRPRKRSLANRDQWWIRVYSEQQAARAGVAEVETPWRAFCHAAWTFFRQTSVPTDPRPFK
jgi:hypothetical protein